MIFGVVVVRMLDDALTNFKGQVQSAEGGVALFEIFDDAKCVQIVIEGEAVLVHGRVERFFSRVPEWRMPEIVHQGERLGQIGVQSELTSDGARNLRDLNGVRQAIAEVVGISARENLSLRLQAAEGASVNDAIAVALIVVAVRMRRLGMASSTGLFNMHRVVGEHGESLAVLAAFEILTAKTQRWPRKSVYRSYESDAAKSRTKSPAASRLG